jgi:hypothetical protein
MPNLAFLVSAQAWLIANLGPAAPWVILTALIFAGVRLSRLWFPGLWRKFDDLTPDGMISHVIQGLPSVLVGAIAGVFLSGGDFATAWKGALSGALAPVIHLVMKNYTGEIAKAAVVVGLLVIASCTPQGTLAPAVQPVVADACAIGTELAPLAELEAERQGITVDQWIEGFKAACKAAASSNDAPTARKLGFKAALSTRAIAPAGGAQ